MKIKRLLSLILLLAIAPIVSRAALFDSFLKLEGIDGESTSPAHLGEIEIVSYSLGISNPGSVAGNTSGKVNVTELKVTKVLDNKSTLKLLEACATGKHINQAVLTVAKGNGKGSVQYLTVTMEDVLITSVQMSGHPGDPQPMEQVSLSFAKVKIEVNGGSLELSVGAETSN